MDTVPAQVASWSTALYHEKPVPLLPLDRLRATALSRALQQPLDRVNVLGEEGRSGHSGCVNALSWANHGELLLSGGDDTTVRIWRMNSANSEQEYPFACRVVINTGHRSNIFNAHMLPYSSRIVTAAADKQVRVFDVGSISSTAPDSTETQYSSRQANVRIFRCHEDRVKRIVTEDSPDLFLSVGEDGTVRQHDLRTPHNCLNGHCPAPLMRVPHELSTLSLSSLTPYYFVVAGQSPYGYLFDRRHYGPLLEEQWGMVPRVGQHLTTCVRRFGRPPEGERSHRSNHITGARVSEVNGHEVLLCVWYNSSWELAISDRVLAYNADGVYLFSTLDGPEDKCSLRSAVSSILPRNSNNNCEDKAGKSQSENVTCIDSTANTTASQFHHEDDDTDESDDDGTEDDDDDDDEEAILGLDDTDDTDESKCEPGVPVIMPRRRYLGALNVATVKDVNFLGPEDEWVCSGSDDGNFFMWNKKSGVVDGIYEGDSSVVNVIEGHPYLPLIAVSGIDTTVKLFAPTNQTSSFSRLSDAQQIMEENARSSRTRRTMRYNIAALLAEARTAMGAEEADVPGCASQ